MDIYSQIVVNYLKPQENNERIGLIISDATDQSKESFRNETGLNIEAMVASIGAIKSAMGLDTSSDWMFGCDKGVPVTKTPYNNAVCAVNKLESYKTDC